MTTQVLGDWPSTVCRESPQRYVDANWGNSELTLCSLSFPQQLNTMEEKQKKSKYGQVVRGTLFLCSGGCKEQVYFKILKVIRSMSSGWSVLSINLIMDSSMCPFK